MTPRPPDGLAPRVVNAMTVDVEDYYQVTAFERQVSRDAWETYSSRVCQNTERVLDVFDRAGFGGVVRQ